MYISFSWLDKYILKYFFNFKLGNKSDLSEHRQVTENEAYLASKKFGCVNYIETSASLGDGFPQGILIYFKIFRLNIL